MKNHTVHGSKSGLYRTAGLISYAVGYYYVKHVVWTANYWDRPGWSALIFTLVFIASVELFAGLSERLEGRKTGGGSKESLFFAACCIVQAAAMAVYGCHNGRVPEIYGAEWGIGLFQIVFWHFTAIYYVLARTGMLAAGRTGVWFPLDAVEGLIWLPLTDIFLRAKSVFRKEKRSSDIQYEPEEFSSMVEADRAADERDRRKSRPHGQRTGRTAEETQRRGQRTGRTAEETQRRGQQTERTAEETQPTQPVGQRMQTALPVALSVAIAAVVLLTACIQLAGVTESFSCIGDAIEVFFKRIFSGDSLFLFVNEVLPYFILSIPVSAWMFGLAGGCIRRPAPPCPADTAERAVRRCRILPVWSSWLIIGVLLGVYALFFLVSAGELSWIFTAPWEHVEVYRISDAAVRGFWQLIRVVALNFAVIYGSMLLSQKRLWDEKGTRRMAVLLLASNLLFGLLAFWKLFVLYMGMFGITPRRILSGWALCVLLFWTILGMIRLYRQIPAARIGIMTAAASFSCLMLLPMERL